MLREDKCDHRKGAQLTSETESELGIESAEGIAVRVGTAAAATEAATIGIGICSGAIAEATSRSIGIGIGRLSVLGGSRGAA